MWQRFHQAEGVYKPGTFPVHIWAWWDPYDLQYPPLQLVRCWFGNHLRLNTLFTMSVKHYKTLRLVTLTLRNLPSPWLFQLNGFGHILQAHTIHTLTNQPLRQVLKKLETSGRLIKWAIELGEFDIHFKPWPFNKGQAVADFISEFTEAIPLASS